MADIPLSSVKQNLAKGLWTSEHLRRVQNLEVKSQSSSGQAMILSDNDSVATLPPHFEKILRVFHFQRAKWNCETVLRGGFTRETPKR